MTATTAPMTATTRTAARTAAFLLAATLGLSACTGGDETPDDGSSPTPSPTPADTASPSPTDAGSPSPTASGDTSNDGDDDAPAFPANTQPDTGEAAGGSVGTLIDIRLGGHEGFDRVVFEFTGEGTPSWNVRYVDDAIQDASGRPVAVDGDAILEVTLFSVDIPEPDGAFYDGPDEIRVEATEQVTEVVFSSLFEGYLQAFIGVDDGEQPFRAYAMEDPSRIVVEVRDDG